MTTCGYGAIIYKEGVSQASRVLSYNYLLNYFEDCFTSNFRLFIYFDSENPNFQALHNKEGLTQMMNCEQGATD